MKHPAGGSRWQSSRAAAMKGEPGDPVPLYGLKYGARIEPFKEDDSCAEGDTRVEGGKSTRVHHGKRQGRDLIAVEPQMAE
jgi:hypothetical protein